ncbi:MAG TPA: response regulator [Microthrixaceae bacterium]|nr:response regulator [Microthrixaceae bacterium]
MQRVLVATDADEVFDEIDAALASRTCEVVRVRSGREVRTAVQDADPDLVVLDLQIGSMGGMATCMDLRLEEGAGRVEPQNILMLLDRDADVFLAERSDADGWLIKPLDAGRVRRATEALVAGDSYTETPRTAVG